jgi:arylsulfatase A-like enzyme
LNGEHGMVDKRTMHEPSIRVPLVVRYPALTQARSASEDSGLGVQGSAGTRPRVMNQQVLTIDFAPSILDICGVTPLPKVHGASWRKLAQGDATGWRTSWYYEYNYESQFPYTPNVRGVRTDRYKYIRYPHGDGGPDQHMAELYEIQADSDETTNLIGRPEHAETVAGLKRELDRLMAAAGGLPDKMPLDAGIKSALPAQAIR